MSLIQDALEKVQSPEPEIPKPIPQVHEEPRLQNIKFYETVETSKAKKKITASVKFSPQIRFITMIGGLLLLSLVLGRLWIPASKTSVPSMPMPSQSVIAKTQTPITQKTISQIKFTLTGITQADGILLALINNQVVGEGDKLRENAIVKSVTEDTATLEWQGRQMTLTL